MTTLVELERIAARQIPPQGASDVVAVVDVERCGQLSNGTASGVIVEADGTKRLPRTRYGAAWFDGLRRSEPIAWFEKPSDAYLLIDLLTGRAPRSARHSVADTAARDVGPAEGRAVPGARSRRSSSRPPTDPSGGRLNGVVASSDVAGSPGVLPIDTGAAVLPVAAGSCAACGRSFADLPPSRSGQTRKTCSDACRQAYRRGHRAPVPGVVAPESLEAMSRLPRPFSPGIDARDPDPAPDVDQLALDGAGAETWVESDRSAQVSLS